MQLPNHKFYNCIATDESGSEYFIDANWIHNNNLDQWKDWKCSAGHDRIFIAADGSVYSGECSNNLLGNMDTGWKLFETPTICQRDRCTGCTDDLIISKEF